MRRVLFGATLMAMLGVGSVGAIGAIPAAAAPGTCGLNGCMTDNVTYVMHLPLLGDGVGARIVGHYLYATSSKDLEIYDISVPTAPALVSSLTVNVAWENEQVPTNGKILGISDSTGCESQIAAGDPVGGANAGTCLSIYDVSDKANPKLLTNVDGAGDHTSTCILDCTFMYGSSGHITDLRHVTDPGHPAAIVGSWFKPATPATSAHHVKEVAPGYILTATQPVLLLSVRAEDGADPVHPRVLATGTNADHRFIHSEEWAQNGMDKFALIGGETNFQPTCDPTRGAFMTWDASRTHTDGHYNPGSTMTMVDEWRPTQGTPDQGQQVVGVLGCSVHWFEPQPAFHDGGLVALAAYESGTRFLQVDSAGKIHEQGWYVPSGAYGSTSAPHWAPDGRTLYALDYERGIDVLQWTGPLYVPNGGTAGASTSPSPSPTPSNAPSPVPSPAPVPGPRLPNTGAPLGWLPPLTGLTVAGAAALLTRRGTRLAGRR